MQLSPPLKPPAEAIVARATVRRMDSYMIMVGEFREV